ncbi:hypothetical protein PG997_006759 [Apiospora hydei]|uniref:Uncharacterized protein n=1 Tax=Apiospora hydei TaxID=1337664 RepID=A0ABR1WS52_9PEZI
MGSGKTVSPLTTQLSPEIRNSNADIPSTTNTLLQFLVTLFLTCAALGTSTRGGGDWSKSCTSASMNGCKIDNGDHTMRCQRRDVDSKTGSRHVNVNDYLRGFDNKATKCKPYKVAARRNVS